MRKTKVKILVIEDERADVDRIREMLLEDEKWEFSIENARYLGDALEALRTRSFDVALVDLGLPDSRGLETALAVRNAARHTPVVVLTALKDEEAARSSLEMDIQDYLVKGESTGEMVVRSIRHAVERKRLADELWASEQRFSAFMLNLPAAAWMKDLEGKYVYINPEAERVFSTPLSEISGKTDDEIFPPEVARQFRENDLRAVSEGKTIQTTETLRRADGYERHFIVSKFAVPGPGGRPAYVGGVAIDITDRRRAEEEIGRLNADMAARAAELEFANRELEAFNYTVAHDLRKPLTAINGYCRIIMEACADGLGEECMGYLQEAYEGTWRMNRLIDALLDFSRLAHSEIKHETVDLSLLAHDVADGLRAAEPERQVTFRIADGVRVVGDAALLLVVLDNLMGNAWKYTSMRKEAFIEFGVREIDGKPTYFVSDTGTGFEMAYAEKLFAPFARLPGVDEFRGFGIGLATVERIVARHGGRIWAEGEPGKGAIFYFILPQEQS